MPRRQPARSPSSGTHPSQQPAVDRPPPIDNPTYQELLKAENDAYLAWLHYRPDDQGKQKQTLSALRGVYEERHNLRKAYQNKG